MANDEEEMEAHKPHKAAVAVPSPSATSTTDESSEAGGGRRRHRAGLSHFYGGAALATGWGHLIVCILCDLWYSLMLSCSHGELLAADIFDYVHLSEQERHSGWLSDNDYQYGQDEADEPTTVLRLSYRFMLFLCGYGSAAYAVVTMGAMMHPSECSNRLITAFKIKIYASAGGAVLAVAAMCIIEAVHYVYDSPEHQTNMEGSMGYMLEGLVFYALASYMLYVHGPKLRFQLGADDTTTTQSSSSATGTGTEPTDSTPSTAEEGVGGTAASTAGADSSSLHWRLTLDAELKRLSASQRQCCVFAAFVTTDAIRHLNSILPWSTVIGVPYSADRNTVSHACMHVVFCACSVFLLVGLRWRIKNAVRLWLAYTYVNFSHVIHDCFLAAEINANDQAKWDALRINLSHVPLFVIGIVLAEMLFRQWGKANAADRLLDEQRLARKAGGVRRQDDKRKGTQQHRHGEAGSHTSDSDTSVIHIGRHKKGKSQRSSPSHTSEEDESTK